MDYFIADPAGNITAFILGQPDPAAAEKLLQAEPRVEQVAFLRRPVNGGHIKCDMAGGEFCGNACRAAAFYYARREGIAFDCTVKVEMSGTDGHPVTVAVDPQKGRAFAAMPLPERTLTVNWEGHVIPAVIFHGIIHFIIPGNLSGRISLTKQKMHQLCANLKTAALGVMFLSPDLRLKPVVWVDQVGTLIWESSCGSGSVACAWWLSRDLKQGWREYCFSQPGGELEIIVNRTSEGSELQMGGAVSLLDDPLWRKL